MRMSKETKLTAGILFLAILAIIVLICGNKLSNDSIWIGYIPLGLMLADIFVLWKIINN